MQPTAATAIECAIRTAPQSGYVKIEAVARSASPTSGRYRFLVDKQSDTGRSSNTQSGSFVLQAGQEQVLTTIVLDGSAADHYRAKLMLDSDHGSLTCTAP